MEAQIMHFPPSLMHLAAIRAELNLLLMYADSEITIRKHNVERVLENVNALAALEGLDQHTSKVA